MSVDFPPSYPTNTPQANKPADLNALQEAFSVALSKYIGTQGGEGSQTDTMLEVINPAQQIGDSDKEDRQQRREIQKQENRNDFTQIDRKLQNKSELRQGDLETDYQNRIDKHAVLRNDYQANVDRQQQSTTQAESPPPPQQDRAIPSQEPLSHENSLLQHQANTVAIETNNQNQSAVTLTHSLTQLSAGAVQQSAGVSAHVSMPIPASLPVSTAVPMAAPHTFTIFTASGRLGQQQERSEENEKEKDEEKEESVGENTTKKKSPFAALHAIHMEAARPIRQSSARQLQESPIQTDSIGKEVKKEDHPRKKPLDTDSDPSLSINDPHKVNTLHELLKQKAAGPQKDESHSSNQSLYLNRITAACEAASMYAPIRIKINLEHLGTLTLRFSHKTNKADELALRFETPTKETERFLHHHLEQLKSMLAKRSTRITSLEVIRQGK